MTEPGWKIRLPVALNGFSETTATVLLVVFFCGYRGKHAIW